MNRFANFCCHASIIAMFGVAGAVVLPTISHSETSSECVDYKTLVGLIQSKAKLEDYDSPEFRIKRADDGQSLIYWHYGEKTGSFYAATFRTDGCAILTSKGDLRRFAFPKTAFNTGVFFELDVLEIKP
ncbi:MAG: hypothetical protein AAF423_06545 [Pseudomonadota bacterium]